MPKGWGKGSEQREKARDTEGTCWPPPFTIKRGTGRDREVFAARTGRTGLQTGRGQFRTAPICWVRRRGQRAPNPSPFNKADL